MLSDTLFLTFDFDWAPDEIILYTYKIICEADICATFFVTHQTPVLELLRNDPHIELGAHPNFNSCFEGVGAKAEDILAAVMEIVPEAVSVRTHSLTGSSYLKPLFKKYFTFDCSAFFPAYAGIRLAPYRDFSGMICMPHCFEDDLALFYNCIPQMRMEAYLSMPSLKIFDFHPIHVFLDTVTMEQYQLAKPYYQQPEVLRNSYNGGGVLSQICNNKDGSRSLLLRLIREGKAQGKRFCRIKDVDDMREEIR